MAKNKMITNSPSGWFEVRDKTILFRPFHCVDEQYSMCVTTVRTQSQADKLAWELNSKLYASKREVERAKEKGQRNSYTSEAVRQSLDADYEEKLASVK